MSDNSFGWGINTSKNPTPTGGGNISDRYGNYSMSFPRSDNGDSMFCSETTIFTSNSSSIAGNCRRTNQVFGNYGGTGNDNIFNYTMGLCAEVGMFTEMIKPLIAMKQQQANQDRMMDMYENILTSLLDEPEYVEKEVIIDDTGPTDIDPDDIETEEVVVKRRDLRSLRSR